MSKPRYWPVAYPLAITSLCVAPHQYFLKHWVALFEAGHSKLKVRVFNMVTLGRGLISTIVLGKALSNTGHEWHDAPPLDISVSLPRAGLDNYLKARLNDEAFLPGQPTHHYALR